MALSPPTVEELVAFAVRACEDITPKQDGGVMKEVLRRGEGERKPGLWDDVSVHFVGKFLDGTQFENSRDGGNKLSFKVGDGKVIKALDVCLPTMRAGEISRIVCRPDYAYGEGGLSPKIPPNTVLIFEIELLEWKGECAALKKHGGHIRTILRKGQGAHPNYGSLVTVELRGYYLGNMFDERVVQFPLGDGCDYNIVYGAEKALMKFKRGECSRIKLSPKYAFGDEGAQQYSIPSGAEIVYEITLKDFTKAKELWEITTNEKMKLSELCKDKGNDKLKSGNTSIALRYYERAKTLLADDPMFTEDELKRRNELLLALHLNCALCHLKLESWSSAKDSCLLALTLDGSSEKANFRNGQAYMGLCIWEEAIPCFEKALQINPKNSSAKAYIQEARKNIDQQEKKAKSTFQGMFEKFASIDAQKLALNKAKGNFKEEPIGYWSNDMANGMLSLHQEMEAFGELIPDGTRSYNDDDDYRKG